MALDELIRQAARAGATGVTLWLTPGGSFQANVKLGDGWLCATATDPVEALRRALSEVVPAKPETDIFE